MDRDSPKRELLLTENDKTAASIPTAQAAPVTGAAAQYDTMMGMGRGAGPDAAIATPPAPPAAMEMGGGGGGRAHAMTGGDDDKQCRICLEIGRPGIPGARAATTADNLIAPCTCKGPQKFVHRRCLDQYRAVKRDTTAFTHCDRCSFEYWLRLRPDRKRGKRKLKFRALVFSHTLLMFLILQALIVTFGYIVYAIDTSHEICTQYTVCQTGHCTTADTEGKDTCEGGAHGLDLCPKGYTCRKMGRLRHKVFVEKVANHEKTTYYTCGFLLFFACLGIGGCCSGFASREKRGQPDYDPLADCDCLYYCLCYNKAERGWATHQQHGATANYKSPTGSIRRMRTSGGSGGGGGGGGSSSSSCPTDCRCDAGDDCCCCCDSHGICCNDPDCWNCWLYSGDGGGCNCSGADCGNCDCDCGGGGGDCGEAGAILLVLAVVLVVFFAFIGVLYGLILGSALLQRIVQRHYHVLQRRLLAKDYVVQDLRNVDLSAYEAIAVAAPAATADIEVGVAGMAIPSAPVYDKQELQRLLGVNPNIM